LLDYLDKHYEVIIIDTAPIGLVTDAHVLSNMCNTTLYIVRHTYSPKVILKRFDQNNEINPLKNPAIIFNGVKARGYIKNNYGHGYGYGSSYVSVQKA
jgi:Mrp family chromosome partitioning ATPase